MLLVSFSVVASPLSVDDKKKHICKSRVLSRPGLHIWGAMNSIEYEAVNLLPEVYDFTSTGDHFLETREVNMGDAVLVFKSAWNWSLVDRSGNVITEGNFKHSTLADIVQRVNNVGKTDSR